MPYQCRLVDRKAISAEELKPGDMWFLSPWEPGSAGVERMRQGWLSGEYMRDHDGKRPPICVVLPSGETWTVDMKATDEDGGWTVTGEAPMITAHPSIQTRLYHGWLQNGVLSDDLEGRSYG